MSGTSPARIAIISFLAFGVPCILLTNPYGTSTSQRGDNSQKDFVDENYQNVRKSMHTEDNSSNSKTQTRHAVSDSKTAKIPTEIFIAQDNNAIPASSRVYDLLKPPPKGVLEIAFLQYIGNGNFPDQYYNFNWDFCAPDHLCRVRGTSKYNRRPSKYGIDIYGNFSVIVFVPREQYHQISLEEFKLKNITKERIRFNRKPHQLFLFFQWESQEYFRHRLLKDYSVTSIILTCH